VEELPVTRTLLTGLPAFLILSACATDPYGNPPNAGTRTAYGAAAGAAIGALAGSALGGDAMSGAAAGALAGGAAGALIPGSTFQGRQYYRDTRGYCYYIDRNGQPQYDGTVRC
jgi:uncharacterized protein YcfJ